MIGWHRGPGRAMGNRIEKGGRMLTEFKGFIAKGNVVDLAVGIIIGAESAAAFDELTISGVDDQLTRQNKNDWPNAFRTARLIPAVEYINANRHRYLLMQKMQTFFETVDVVITPTFGGSQLAVTNLTGYPALCMPTGFNQRKLPTSISFIGKLYDEATLLQVGKLFQDFTGWDDVHPAMFQ